MTAFRRKLPSDLIAIEGQETPISGRPVQQRLQLSTTEMGGASPARGHVGHISGTVSGWRLSQMAGGDRASRFQSLAVLLLEKLPGDLEWEHLAPRRYETLIIDLGKNGCSRMKTTD